MRSSYLWPFTGCYMYFRHLFKYEHLLRISASSLPNWKRYFFTMAGCVLYLQPCLRAHAYVHYTSTFFFQQNKGLPTPKTFCSAKNVGNYKRPLNRWQVCSYFIFKLTVSTNIKWSFHFDFGVQDSHEREVVYVHWKLYAEELNSLHIACESNYCT